MNIQENIKSVLDSIEIDDRLLDTPQRVDRALNEFFNGYDADINKILSVKYPSEIDELIILKNIPILVQPSILAASIYESGIPSKKFLNKSVSYAFAPAMIKRGR